MSDISSDKHDGTGVYGAWHPKNKITLDADNSIIQLTTFEFSHFQENLRCHALQ